MRRGRKKFASSLVRSTALIAGIGAIVLFIFASRAGAAPPWPPRGIITSPGEFACAGNPDPYSCCPTDDCERDTHNDFLDGFDDFIQEILDEFTTGSGQGALDAFEQWMLDWLFNENILQVIVRMTHQFTIIIMQQTFIIGTWFDAEIQMDTQNMMRRLATEAHKDYHPSYTLCTFGTNVRSLAAADFNRNLTYAALNQHSIRRQLGSANVNASDGRQEDREGRLEHFSDRFCDRFDNNALETDIETGLGLVCQASVQPETVNLDVDFTRTFLAPRTLEIDMADGTETDDEEAIFAMGSNLYGHELIRSVSDRLTNAAANQDNYIEFRSVVAKRSVAQNSFNAIVALKTQGSAASAIGTNQSNPGTAAYMTNLLQELGIPDPEIEELIGERPSYYSQLEILAKRIFQRQGFYIDLYGKPANVMRKKVAMQAINLMLERDIHNSYLRSEAIMSILLEIRVAEAQNAVNDMIGQVQAEGTP